jgi:predicted PurR-regulated permease PerM
MDRDTREFARKVILASLIVAAAYLLVSHFSYIMGFIRTIISALTPVIAGMIIAFILNAPMSRLESFIKRKKPDLEQKWVRRIAVICTYLGALLIFGILISVVIPQLWGSLIALASNLPSYITSVVNFINQLLKQMNLNFHISLDDLFNVPIDELGTSLAKWIEGLTPKISDWISKIDPAVVSDIGRATAAVIKVVVKLCLGTVFSVYVLLSKEKFKQQARTVLEAFRSEETVAVVRHLIKSFEKVFSDFISGQLVEMSVLGLFFFVVLTIAGMPYALLISVVIAVTSIIPYFGSFMALAFGAILILAVSGLVRMIVFIALFLIMQQIDNNFIYPNIVGSSVGLPPVWVLVAVTFFGSVFGLPGMACAVPTMALLYTLFSELVQNRLTRKEELKKRLEEEADQNWL